MMKADRMDSTASSGNQLEPAGLNVMDERLQKKVLMGFRHRFVYLSG